MTPYEVAVAGPIEFWPWLTIPEHLRREVTDTWEREVLGETFLGEPVWLPYMGPAQ